MIYEIRTAPVGTREYNSSRVVPPNQMPTGFDCTAGYSIYPYPPDFPEWFKRNNNSVANYQGKVGMGWFPLDIEVKDEKGQYSLEKAQEVAVGMADWLAQRFGIEREANQYFYSGNKGFHILVNAKWFTGQPSFGYEHDMCHKARRLLNGLLAEKAGVTLQVMEGRTLISGNHYGFDFNIYKPAQILSCPNSVHPISRLYKVRVSFAELSSWDSAKIKLLAGTKRLSGVRAAEMSVCQRQDELAAMWASALTATASDYQREHSDHEREGFFAAPSQGNRNETLFKQACHLYEHSGLPDSHVEEIIYNIAHASNASATEAMPDKEVAVILRSARKRVARKSPQQAKEAKASAEYDPTLSDSAMLAEEFVTYWTTERCKMTTGIKEFDEEFRGNFKGLLLPVIGPAGTKKSFWAQHVAVLNVALGERILYSSMEMSRVALFGRLLDVMSMESSNIPLSLELRDLLEKREQAYIDHARQYLQVVADTYSDKVIVSADKRMTAAKYKKAILKAQELYGKVGILVVDGLSMMASTDNEVADMGRHTMELKELAIELDIMIIMIVHTNKGGDKFSSDHGGNIRGSEKIKDNSDAFVFLSCMVDMVESTTDDTRELRNCGIAKVWSKRGTGLEYATTFRFDGKKKSFTYDPPEMYIDYKLALSKWKGSKGKEGKSW